MPRAGQGKPPKDMPQPQNMRLFGTTLRVVLNRVVEKARNGQEARTNMMLVAEELVSQAKGGDVAAIREIADRIDGKVVQQLNHGNGPDGKELPKGVAIVFVSSEKE